MLAVFLPVGDSFRKLAQTGQSSLMIDQNLASYAKNYQKVWVFTYEKETIKLPKNCHLVTPPFFLHRYLYAILLPFLHQKILQQTNLIRCFHLSGIVPALIAKIFYGKKFVFNFGYDYQAFAIIEKKPLSHWLFRLLQPFALKFASGIIVKNNTLLSSRIYDLRSKIMYIPNGVNPKIFKPAISNKPLATSSVLFVGRLEPQKNVLTLIEAISKLKQPIKLVIVGDGSLRQAAIDLARRLQVNLKLHRRLPHDQLPKIYRQASIFVLPSVKEGSPKVLLEAMSSGLPCIASDIAEHQEIINNHRNGILVKPTVENLNKTLNKLLTNGQLQKRLGSAARQTILTRFNQTTLMQQELEFMQSL